MDWWLALVVFGLSWLFVLKMVKLLQPPLSPPPGFNVIVVGAGPGGIAVAKRLNDMGIR